jgi:hypothetical protein
VVTIPKIRLLNARGGVTRRIVNKLAALALVVLPGGLGVLLGGCGGSTSGSGGQTQTPTAATPTFSPIGGTYTAAQSVTISDVTAGAAIYYTTDGSTPTASSTKYGGAFTVSATETINAIAVASGYNNSAVASAAYTINLPAVATPTFSPAGGTYTGAQSVTISDATAGATIYYYTTDGSTPTAGSTLYAGPITVSTTEAINAIAVASGYTNSGIATSAYTINLPVVATPTFSPAGGTYPSAQSVTISDSTAGAAIYYTTDGSTPTANSTKYSGAVIVSATETLSAIAVASGYANSAVASAMYTINLQAATPTFSLAAGTYTGNQTDSLSDATTSAKIYYTIDGSTPTTSSTLYTAPIAIDSSETVKSIAVASGYTNSNIASAAYVINPAQTNPAQNIFSNIAAVFNGPASSGGRVVVYDTLNGFLGSNQTAGLGSNLGGDVTNPSSSDGLFGNTGLFVGGPYISVGTTAITKPLFILDQAATGQSTTTVLSSYVETITINPTAGTAVPTFQSTNFVALPFGANTDGSLPTPYGVNTGADIAVCASNNAQYGFIPISNGSTLGTFAAAAPPVAPTQDCSGVWIDSNKNVGVTSGTGANAVLNMYDSQGNWLLSATGGVISLNSTNGSTLNAISASTDVQSSISVSPTLSQSLNLYYLQNGTLTSLYIEPGTDGAKPTLTFNNVANPNGGSLGSSVTLIAGTQRSPGIPQSIGLLTGSTLFSLSVTPYAQGLSFTETGNAVWPFTSGIMLSQTPTTYLAASTSTSQPGAYAVQKLAGGSLGSPTLSSPYLTGPTGIVVDNNNNPSAPGTAYVANFNSIGDYENGASFTNIPANGGAIFTVSPTLGTGVNFTNSTAN